MVTRPCAVARTANSVLSANTPATPAAAVAAAAAAAAWLQPSCGSRTRGGAHRLQPRRGGLPRRQQSHHGWLSPLATLMAWRTLAQHRLPEDWCWLLLLQPRQQLPRAIRSHGGHDAACRHVDGAGRNCVLRVSLWPSQRRRNQLLFLRAHWRRRCTLLTLHWTGGRIGHCLRNPSSVLG